MSAQVTCPKCLLPAFAIARQISLASAALTLPSVISIMILRNICESILLDAPCTEPVHW